MTTRFLLDPAGETSAPIDLHRAFGPVRMAGARLHRRLDRAVDRLATNVAVLLQAYDHCLVALDDDLDIVFED